MTIRDLIREIQEEVLDTADLLPERAAELLTKLTAIIGNCNDEIRVADHAYSVELLRFLDADEAANRARIRAETSLQFLRKREARDSKELVIELVRSLKYFLKSKEEEMRLAR